MLSSMPKPVNIEAKPAIIQIRIEKLPGDYKQTFESK